MDKNVQKVAQGLKSPMIQVYCRAQTVQNK